MNGNKPDIPAAQITARNAAELTARLKYFMTEHAKALAEQPVTVVVIKMQREGAQ